MPPEGKVHYKRYYLLLFAVLLLVINIYFFTLEIKGRDRRLTFAMLDIGQGDGLFIESPTGVQILVDGGPPRTIINKLSQVMSPFDRSIDTIIVTNPDQDHIGGLVDVLKAYKVGVVLEPGTSNDSSTYKNLEEKIKSKNIPDILAKAGMQLDLGGGAVLDILFPDRDVSTWASNDGSVVAKLSYGDTSVILTGDATLLTEREVLKANPASKLDSTLLKVGHHGSHTSSSYDFVKAVSPEYALISDGKDNKYGHPHQTTLDILTEAGAKIFRTDLLGSIIMKSDGKSEAFSFQR